MNKPLDQATESGQMKKITMISLWFDQYMRRLRGRPFRQAEVLDKIMSPLQADQNVLGILLFGSMASDTHTWKSDIDLIFIYENHDPPSGLVTLFVDSIEVQFFFTTLETLMKNFELVPYLLHMFSNGKILFDRHGTVRPVIEQIAQYFVAHPDVTAAWDRFAHLHQVEKKGPQCEQTTIIQRWDELEEKYSGGVRKRTFFLT